MEGSAALLGGCIWGYIGNAGLMKVLVTIFVLLSMVVLVGCSGPFVREGAA